VLTTPWIAIACLSLVGLGLRLRQLGERDLWLDELSTLGAAAMSFGDFLRAVNAEANMTLFYWLLFAWLRVVGFQADEFAIRLPAAILGALAVPLIYLLGRQLHSHRAGLAAAGLLAVHGFHVLWSQEARSYSLLATLTILSYLLLDRAIERSRRWAWVLHAVATALAFYCHAFTLFTILAQAVLVLSRRSRATLFAWLGSSLLTAALLLPLVPFYLRQSSGTKIARLLPPTLLDLQNFFIGFSGGSGATFALYLALAILGLGLTRADRRQSSYRNWLLLSWLLVPIVLAFGISLVRPILRERYLFAALPALVLLASVGLARLPRPMGVAAFALTAASSLAALQFGFGGIRPPDNEAWQAAVQQTTASSQPGDGWAFISKKAQNGFDYYGDWAWGRNPAAPYVDVLEPFDWQAALQDPDYEWKVSPGELERFAASHPRIWLVLSHQVDRAAQVDLAAPVDRWLLSNGYQATERKYPGLQIRLYERPDQGRE
jgi:4-amino-4-deoxy-L-arabinose transferase-like glycosyltransferase